MLGVPKAVQGVGTSGEAGADAVLRILREPVGVVPLNLPQGEVLVDPRQRAPGHWNASLAGAFSRDSVPSLLGR